MIEINTLIRFLNKDPDLHLELWEAEGDRNAASIIEDHNELHTERWGPMPVMDGVLDEKRERLRNARAKALAARTAGVGKKGPVMPSMAKQLVTIAEPAASEAYTFGYRPMSWETHTNPRVFLSGAFVEHRQSGGSNDRWAKQPQTISSAKAEWAAATLRCSGRRLAQVSGKAPIPLDCRAFA
jgi:hypothetical protein